MRLGPWMKHAPNVLVSQVHYMCSVQPRRPEYEETPGNAHGRAYGWTDYQRLEKPIGFSTHPEL
ncbi:hypothetical protein LOZ66_004706 [Ophidiomyces ophidiicola]|nr:hypothetical protein LOZ66_004706 [Ophidiomyces ophidiicola]